MKNNVLEIEIIKVNEEWSTWYITYQNEEVFLRGKFKDEELGVYSRNFNPMFTGIAEEMYLRGKSCDLDLMPIAIRNKYVPGLEKKVDQINEKYGIEKIGNSGVDRAELKNDILTLQGICNVLYFDLDSLADEEMKNKLTRLKDMLEYILEAF